MFPTTRARIILSLYFDPDCLFRGRSYRSYWTYYSDCTCASESTIPTIVQSVGVSSRLKGKLASFPRHQKTSSPTPAPAASIATIGLHYGSNDARELHIQSPTSDVRSPWLFELENVGLWTKYSHPPYQSRRSLRRQ